MFSGNDGVSEEAERRRLNCHRRRVVYIVDSDKGPLSEQVIRVLVSAGLEAVPVHFQGQVDVAYATGN